MKEKELREIAKCSLCDNMIGKHNRLTFYRVRVERYAVNLPALQRQQGLAMMVGGNGFLASVLGPNEDMAEKIESTEVTVCATCAMEAVDLDQLLESKADVQQA